MTASGLYTLVFTDTRQNQTSFVTGLTRDVALRTFDLPSDWRHRALNGAGRLRVMRQEDYLDLAARGAFTTAGAR